MSALVWRSGKDAAFARFGSDALHEEGYCRLTREERDFLRPVNDGAAWFGEHSAGISLRFETDSVSLAVRVVLRGKFDMTNMTQIAQCGLDLYVWDDRVNGFALHEVARYDFDATRYEVPLSHFTEKKPRRFLIHLPLYMAVDALEIGLDRDAYVKPYGFETDLRIGVYGTSITHGCAASRPGLAYTNILSRRLGCETLNFGFSGVAFLEREMGEILGRRRLDALAVDAEPNAGVDERLERNAEGFLEAFLSRNGRASVVLFSRVKFALDLYDGARAALAARCAEHLRMLAEKFSRQGYDVRFADGGNIFEGNFTEYTTDGVHPNDMGMAAIAALYEREFRPVLRERTP